MKATQALVDWMRQSQGEKYAKELTKHAEECHANLLAAAASSTDPAVRALFYRFKAFDEQATFLRNARKEEGVEDDE